jgi:site-specific DNA-methyltransferase (adenine-specific)
MGFSSELAAGLTVILFFSFLIASMWIKHKQKEAKKMDKANNGKGNIPERDMWETPQELWDNLHSQYCFTLDCCADKFNAKLNNFTNGFESMYCKDEIGWMNPPFSKAKNMFKRFFEALNKGVAIYRCDNFETKIWQKVIFPNASWIFIPDKRIVYEGMDGNGSRFPSALIGFNVPKPTGLKGVILEVSLLSSPT